MSTTQSNVQIDSFRSWTRSCGEVLITATIEVVSKVKVEAGDSPEVAVIGITAMTMHVSTVVKHIHPSHALLMV